MKIKLLFTLILLSLAVINAQSFLRTEGKKIVDETGNEVILKGIGLGGWLVQEGYMLQTSGFASAEHEIRAKIEELIGREKTSEYYDKYHENYVREEDIAALAEWGFNSVRLPMHYNKLMESSLPLRFLEKGFSQIDDLISWCKKYDLYVILDLHAAPGGQSDEAISDYDPSKYSLWESDLNKDLTVDLWAEIARRYKDEKTVGGYDLINETKWELPPDNQPLRDLYIRITDAIREVDQNHMIIIEGNWYANDFTGLGQPWDDNMVYSFHKYWNANDQDAIGWMLRIRNDTNCPLWLGETGENSNSWNTDCIKLMEANNIGWAWWPHKKIENIRGPLSAVSTPQYQRLLDYWNGRASKPDADYAFNALMNQAEMLKIENCNFNKGYIDAMFRQVHDNTSIPYKEHSIPGRIYAVDYDMGPRGVAWQDKEYEMINGSWFNNGWAYRNDGVDIEECNDGESNGYNVGWIETEDWLNFTVNVINEGTYDISLRIAGMDTGGKISMNIGNTFLFTWLNIPNTGGSQNWQTIVVEDVYMPAGEQVLTVRFLLGGFNLNYIQFWPKTVGVEENENQPDKFSLYQNYPNPFNPATVVKFNLPAESNVKLTLYNSLGAEVSVIENDLYDAGTHEFRLDFSNTSLGLNTFTSGVYYLRMNAEAVDKTENYHSVIKMILLK